MHQENHARNTTDTRGGVYGELNAVSEKHLGKFVRLMPQEAQCAQVGRAVAVPTPRLSGALLVAVPNEHALRSAWRCGRCCRSRAW